MQITEQRDSQESRQHWRLEDINFDSVRPELVYDDQFLFQTLASASLVEILSETYADNLIRHYQGDEEVTGWLRNAWQRDEVQHGQALKRYVQTVWPEFDWDKAYAGFRAEYSALCTMEQLEQHKGLELIARCVIETGTSSFYRAMQNYVQEPVLCQILGKIKSDENSHYAHFRRYFETYNLREKHGLGAIVATIWRRLQDISGEDAFIAFKYVQAGRRAGQTPLPLPLKVEWQNYNRKVKRLARDYYPYGVAIKMLIKPVPLSEPLKKLLQWPLIGLAVCITYI